MALKENKIPSQEDLKSQPTKFTDEELNKLKGLQDRTNNVVFAFGQQKIAELRLESQLNNLKGELNKLQKEEADLAGSLSTKYGKGTLNAETGEFTPSNNNIRLQNKLFHPVYLPEKMT